MSKGDVMNRLSEKLFTKVYAKIDSLENTLGESNKRTFAMVHELLLEERQRAEGGKFGGVMRISDAEIATKLFNGAIMYLDPHDIAVVPHIVFESIWEREITAAWLGVLQTNPLAIVLDIGANFGYFGMLAAQQLDKSQGKVYLFEPNSHLIPYIRKNLSVNWLNENSVVVNAGVADTDGTATLNILEDYTGSSSMHSAEKLDAYLGHKMHIKVDEKQKVEILTIDTFCEQNHIESLDLIKMDIEGYEEKAYAGMRGMVKKSKSVTLFIEFTPDGYENPEKFYGDMLSDFGNIYLIDGEGILQIPSDDSFQSVAAKETDWMMLVFSKLSKNELSPHQG